MKPLQTEENMVTVLGANPLFHFMLFSMEEIPVSKDSDYFVKTFLPLTRSILTRSILTYCFLECCTTRWGDGDDDDDPMMGFPLFF